MGEIVIRPLTTLAEAELVEEVQHQVWGRDDAEVTPAHLLHALAYNGGSLIGAFDGERLVGFVLGVLGTMTDEKRVDQVAAARLKMYSVMAGVVPDFRDHDIGYRLKLAQRDFALQIGVRLITWTFDPLESRNGRFNIAKLGAVCNRYLVNFHGELGGINAGVATDRFDVDWWVTTHRVKSRVTRGQRPLGLAALLGGGARVVNRTSLRADGLRAPEAEAVPDGGNLLLVEVPADFQAVKQADLGLAVAWRRHTRLLFESLFAGGYLATDYLSEVAADGERRNYYLLTFGDS